MRPGLTDRRQRTERRLFDVSARLDRARAELEVIEAQSDALAEQAEEAKVRAIVAETPLAVSRYGPRRSATPTRWRTPVTRRGGPSPNSSAPRMS